MSDAAERLRELAERLVALEVEHTQPAAALLTGSASTGEADEYSDIDLILYFDGAIPDDEAIEAVRTASGGGEPIPIGPRTELACAIQFPVDGVQVLSGTAEDVSASLGTATSSIDPPRQKLAVALGQATALRDQIRLVAQGEWHRRAMSMRSMNADCDRSLRLRPRSRRRASAPPPTAPRAHSAYRPWLR